MSDTPSAPIVFKKKSRPAGMNARSKEVSIASQFLQPPQKLLQYILLSSNLRWRLAIVLAQSLTSFPEQCPELSLPHC